MPLGYKTSFDLLGNVEEVRGGGPWGAGTFAGSVGQRQPSEKELQLATIQGESFGTAINKVNF